MTPEQLAIGALFAALNGLGAAVIKYLVDQNEKKDRRIESLALITERLAATVPDLVLRTKAEEKE